MLSKLAAFIRLSRPIFLAGGFIVYALGALVARYQGFAIDWPLYLVGQLFVTSVQLMTHYLNEYWDVEGDRLNATRTLFSGGSGVLGEGGLSRDVALTAAIVCLASASAAAIALVFQYQAEPPAWVVMILIFLGAYFYSSPPVTLASTGYGEVTTSVLVAGLVPALAHLLQTGRPTILILLATAPLVVLHYVMLLAFEFPDFLSDEASGKRTVLVRIGRRQGAVLHNLLIGLAFVLAVAASYLGLPARVTVSMVIIAPLAVWQVVTVRRMQRGEPISFKRLTFGAVALFALSAYFVAFGFWVVG